MIAYPLYTISYPKYWMVRDKPAKEYKRDNLLFHIKNDDYFGTLATSLNLLKETIEDDRNLAWKRETLHHSIDDLIFLQENFKIKRKEK